MNETKRLSLPALFQAGTVGLLCIACFYVLSAWAFIGDYRASKSKAGNPFHAIEGNAAMDAEQDRRRQPFPPDDPRLVPFRKLAAVLGPVTEQAKVSCMELKSRTDRFDALKPHIVRLQPSNPMLAQEFTQAMNAAPPTATGSDELKGIVNGYRFFMGEGTVTGPTTVDDAAPLFAAAANTALGSSITVGQVEDAEGLLAWLRDAGRWMEQQHQTFDRLAATLRSVDDSETRAAIEPKLPTNGYGTTFEDPLGVGTGLLKARPSYETPKNTSDWTHALESTAAELDTLLSRYDRERSDEFALARDARQLLPAPLSRPLIDTLRSKLTSQHFFLSVDADLVVSHPKWSRTVRLVEEQPSRESATPSEASTVRIPWLATLER